MRIRALGDSITVGQGVTSADCYINKLANHFSVALDSFAVSGAQALDQSWLLQSTIPADVNTIFLGTNDTDRNGTNATRRANYIDAIRALAVGFGNANIMPARRLALSGSWANTSGAGAASGIYTNDATAMATGMFRGNTLYVGFATICSPMTNTSFEVWVDGSLVATVNVDSSSLISTKNGRNSGTVCKRFTGFTTGEHIVVIKNKSSATLSLEFIGYMGQYVSPRAVLVVNTHRKASYYGTDNDANVAAYNTDLSSLVTELQADGHNIHLVDIHSLLNTTTDLVDWCHPSTAGHHKIFVAVHDALMAYGVGTAPTVITLPPAPLDGVVSFNMTNSGNADIDFDNGVIQSITIS